MNTKIFEYNGNQITFNAGDSVMVNATEMAKSFGKLPKDFIRLKSTQEFIDAYRSARGIILPEISSGLIQTINGGSGFGTWMHEDIALEFARWLNPRFAIWCNDRIKELMKHGFTASEHTLDELISNPDLLIGLATELKEERARAELAEQRMEFANQLREVAEITIKQQAPMVKYHDEVLVSNSTFTTTTIAKELGMGAPTLHRELKRRGIMYKVDGHWVLYHQYQGKGYTKTRTASYTDREDRQQTSITTVWTERGREFIHRKLNPELKTA